MAENITDENFDSKVSATEKLALVDFYADWCGPCKVLGPVLDKVAEAMKDEVVLLKTNLDTAPKTAEKFGIERIPTVVLFKQGKPISGFVGMASEQAIKDWILNVKNKADGKPDKTEAKAEAKTEKPDDSNKEEDMDKIIERYDNYAKSNGFRLNPNRKVVEGIIRGLLANQKKHGKKYCPCRRVSGDEQKDAKIICPCAFHKEEIAKDGHCYCNLFVK